MIILHIEAAFASFRQSYARSYGETYHFAPPSTVYGMLLSLVGEHDRRRHLGVKLAFAYKTIPAVSNGLRQASSIKYGLIDGDAGPGPFMDKYETLSGIDFFCWVNSESEHALRSASAQNLEIRISEALLHPENSSRTGVLSLGLSDDVVDNIQIVRAIGETAYALKPCSDGYYELPVWVDHVSAKGTRWSRYEVDRSPAKITGGPGTADWSYTAILMQDA